MKRTLCRIQPHSIINVCTGYHGNLSSSNSASNKIASKLYKCISGSHLWESNTKQFPSAFSLLAKTRQTRTGAAANARKSPIRETPHTLCKSIQQKLRYFSLKSWRLNLSDTLTCSWQNPFNFVQQPSFGVCVCLLLLLLQWLDSSTVSLQGEQVTLRGPVLLVSPMK